MLYEEPRERESQDEELTLDRMRMPAVHCRHAESLLDIMTQ